MPLTPGRSAPSSRTCTVRGICHQNSPVAQIAAASVRTTGVPSAPMAPYVLAWESLATTSQPGWAYPRSTTIWWPIPVPAGWKSRPCCRQNPRIRVYFSTFSGDRFWMSWSRTTTGWRGSWTRSTPMARNFVTTGAVLSWVST